MSYLDGEKGRISLQMYKNRAFGISFPTDGNRHYHDWHTVFEQTFGQYKVTVRAHTDPMELITIEVTIPDIAELEVRTDG